MFISEMYEIRRARSAYQYQNSKGLAVASSISNSITDCLWFLHTKKVASEINILSTASKVPLLKLANCRSRDIEIVSEIS